MVTPGVALLAYPWEFALDPAAAETVAAAGVDAVAVAGAYHAVRALRARGAGPGIVDQPQAAAYWPIDPARYGSRLVPPAPATHPTAAVTAIEQLRTAGLRAGAWLSILHSTRLASAAPDLALVNCFGDVYRHALCPSHDEVRAYGAGLVAEAVDRLAPDWVELEATGYHGYRHASLHDKAGVAVDDDTAFLLSLCFCGGCRAGFAGRGGDPDLLASSAGAEVRRRLTGEQPAPSDLTELPGLTELLRFRDDVATDLLAVAAGPARAAGLPVAVHVGVSRRTTGSRTPLTPALADLADAVVVSTDARPEDEAARDLAAAVATAGSACAVLASVRAFPPDVLTRDGQARRLRDAADAGAAGARVHTFGLIPDERLGWIGAADPWRAAR